MSDFPRFYVWDDTRNSGQHMVWDREATYTDSLGHTNTGDFLRDAAGKAFLYNAESARWVAEESLRKNFPPVHTVAWAWSMSEGSRTQVN